MAVGPCDSIKRRLSTKPGGRPATPGNFQMGDVPGAQGWPMHTTDTEFKQAMMCMQVNITPKTKYL